MQGQIFKSRPTFCRYWNPLKCSNVFWLHKVFWNRMLFPEWRGRLVLSLWRQTSKCSPVSMDILEFVDLMTSSCSRWRSLWVLHALHHAHSRWCQLVLMHVSDQVSIGREVECLWRVIHNCAHCTLAQPFCALLLRTVNLLLYTISVVVLHRFDPKISKEKKHEFVS